MRAGAIIPHGPVRQYVGEPTDERHVIEVFPGGGSESVFLLYEDDGVSLDHTRGGYLRTELRRADAAGGTRFTITRREGTWTPPARSWRLSFRGTNALPQGVELNGTALPRVTSESALEAATKGYFYDAAARRLLVRIADTQDAINVLVRR